VTDEPVEQPAEPVGQPAEAPDQEAGDLLEREGDIAADYLEALLDILDVDGDIDIDVVNERAHVTIVGASLEQLVGEGGQTLEALQELTRLAVAGRTGVRSRLMLDIGGYRERRRVELTDMGRRTAEAVRERGQPRALRPMTPFERKVVHDAVAEVGGVRSESEGEEPERYVVVHPVSDPAH
jgi:spoIIIJ-associated protein